MRILFLEALGASLRNEKVAWEQELTMEQWKQLFDLAQEHKVLPLIFEAVYGCPAAKKADAGYFQTLKRTVIRQVMVQTIKTEEFLSLYRHLKESGLDPVLVKGLVCRSLYPNPDLRSSGDEDLLIRPEDFGTCHGAMLSFGMNLREQETDIENAYEVPYCKAGSPLYIELHKQLFPAESEAYGDLNTFFENIHSRTIVLELQGTPVTAMAHTDHIFYLICHAFKHFLHGGFGLRQICDIVLYARSYGKEIDWQSVSERCASIRAVGFTLAMIRIGQRYLGFDPAGAGIPAPWLQMEVDEGPMLEDLLSAGIYGGASMSRRHSSNMTLEAVARQKRGEKGGNSLRSSLFPPAKKLEGKYPYLKKYPVLLPVAWCQRILRYGRESTGTENGAMEAVNIGRARIALLREYGIID